MAHYRFRLISETGEDLGPFASARSTWVSGERLSRWHGDDLELVSVVAAEHHDLFTAYLVVRPATDG